MRRQLHALALAAALAMLVPPSALAATSCDPLSTGALVPPTAMTTIEVVAPIGLLIDEVCLVTEGSIVPSHLMVDPLAPSLVLDGEGAVITEYSASFVTAPQGTGEDVVVPPASATVPFDDQELPVAIHAGEQPDVDTDALGGSALLGLALMAFGAAAVQFAISRKRNPGLKHQ